MASKEAGRSKMISQEHGVLSKHRAVNLPGIPQAHATVRDILFAINTLIGSLPTGNISYGVTEEQITEQLLSKAGRLISFRLVYDNANGQPKGYGFAEFADLDAADTARRNLDGLEYQGRQLRADFSHQGGKDDSGMTTSQQSQQGAQPSNGMNITVLPTQANGLPPLPPGVDLAPNLTSPDAISNTLSTLPVPQLLDILSQMKGLVVGDPAKATELLKQAPQLSYAIFQALLLMGLVDSSALSSVIHEASQPAQPPQQQIPPPRPTPVGYQQPPPPQQQQQQQYGQYQPPSAHLQDPRMSHVPTPPVQGGMYQPPPQQQAPPPQHTPEQAALLQQVLSLPQAQIDMMGPTERAQIMQLKQSLMGGRM